MVRNFGLLIYHINKYGKILWMVCKRRDTHAFIEFVRGYAYDKDLKNIVGNITEMEKNRIITYPEKDLLDDLLKDRRIKSYQYIRMLTKLKKNLPTIRKNIIQYTDYIPNSKLYTFPKGYIHKNESGKNTAIREFKEETGLSERNLLISNKFVDLKTVDWCGEEKITRLFLTESETKLNKEFKYPRTKFRNPCISNEMEYIIWKTKEEYEKILDKETLDVIYSAEKVILNEI